MALTLLRHAPIAPPFQKRYIGWKDIPIDPTLFDHEKVHILKQQHFDLIYSSDLCRCTETLEMIGFHDFQTDERLREVRFKDEIEGLNFDEVSKLASFRQHYLESRRRWHNYICKEDPIDFELRIISFFNALAHDQNILVCSHAGTLQKLMVLLGYSTSDIDYLDCIRIENITQIIT